MNGIAMLKSATLTEQINIPVDGETKERYRLVKSRGVDVAEEVRKAIKEMMERLEKATA